MIEYKERSIKPIPENLSKIEGHCLEDVLELLEGISKPVIVHDRELFGEIRSHTIILQGKDYHNLYDTIKLISEFDIASGPASLLISAYYKPNTEFDFSKLNGVYEFKDGKFVEKTKIRPPDSYNPEENF